MGSVLRIIDANANRAREAMRVMEEAARFLLDDEPLTQQCKQLRHDLAAELENVRGLELHRDTPRDVGTGITTQREGFRGSTHDVIVAAGKRLSEALRAIEEYGKTLPAPPQVESLRYRAYELERILHEKLGSAARKQFRLCLLLTQSLCKLPWRDVVRQAIDEGCDCVQVREKDMEAGELLAHAGEVVRICHEANVAAIINDRPDIALLVGANGVHLGQTDLPAEEVRKLVGRQLLVGVSTSNLIEAERAAQAGADYCGVGPMFASSTKQKNTLAGPAYLAAYLQWDQLPGLAIGGITPENIHQLPGVKGIAVSACVCSCDEPGSIVAELLSLMS